MRRGKKGSTALPYSPLCVNVGEPPQSRYLKA
nr:MAG TPA: hypothetical protein [Caudoviricetes sp.]